MRKTFQVFLSSGQVIELKAKDCTIEYNTITGALTHYSFKGTDPKKMIWISPVAVVAIKEK